MSEGEKRMRESVMTRLSHVASSLGRFPNKQLINKDIELRRFDIAASRGYIHGNGASMQLDTTYSYPQCSKYLLDMMKI